MLVVSEERSNGGVLDAHRGGAGEQAALGYAQDGTDNMASWCPVVGEEHEEGPPWKPVAAVRPDTSSGLSRLALGYAQDGTKNASGAPA